MKNLKSKVTVMMMTLMMCLVTSVVSGQDRVNREKLSYSDTSDKLTTAVGWSYNTTHGEWIDYNNMIENDKYCKTTALEIDTVIQKEYEIKKIKDIDFSIKGRGGTILLPALIRCKELNTDVTLVFTDGGCDNINLVNRRMLPKKIIYVLTKDGFSGCIDNTGYVVRLPK